ncbi:surfeit locus 1 family protein [Rhodovulum iodosum]|uniref:SURF1-like protein n=1 Tax=Rhodovulum iodosum TaxID=68291 RepID=A0ABV3XWB2_9RHOB|nr:SURF1 family protein [Rhodovulum robiginosum]RSK36747.1 SURF1 family protein [Rhodovulum robiginosum]
MIRRLIAPLLFGFAGAAILIWLGVWQLHRLEWKEGVLAEIDARIGAAPVALPAAPSEAADKYLPVVAQGRLTGEEVFVLTSVKLRGPGHRLIAVFETGGRRVLADLGFRRMDEGEAPLPRGSARIVGNLHWPDEVDGFTPPPEGDLFFARDVAAMAAALSTEPVLIVAREVTPPVAGVSPMPVDSSGIPNDHREYAITWFSLAALWLGMTALLVWRIRRRTA